MAQLLVPPSSRRHNVASAVVVVVALLLATTLALNLRPGLAASASASLATRLQASGLLSNGSQCTAPDCSLCLAPAASADANATGAEPAAAELEVLQQQLAERQAQLEEKQRELEQAQQQKQPDGGGSSDACPPCEAAQCPEAPECPPCEGKIAAEQPVQEPPAEGQQELPAEGQQQEQEQEEPPAEGQQQEQQQQQEPPPEGKPPDQQPEGQAKPAAGEAQPRAAAECPACPACPKHECPVAPPPADPKYDAGIQKRLWQHKPFLSERSLRQGVFSLGEPSRMRRFTHKLLSGKPVSVSAVGGSVTAGQGAVHGNPYMSRLWRWVLGVSPPASPKANHTLKHGAFGGSTSGIFTVCVNDMVQPDADLVLVEFAINDPKATGRFRDPDRLGFERLLRKLLTLKSRPAVVLLHHYSWFTAGGGRGKRADYVYTAENDFNVLGQYYGLPILSIRAAAYHLMLTNVKGYMAELPLVGHEKTLKEEDVFYFDVMHPADGTGHAALADLVVALVQATAVDLERRPLGAADKEIAEEPLPAPMVPGNLQRNSSTCLLQRDFEKVVVAQDGFEWKNERPGGDFASEKWGWISERAGAWAELVVDTTSDLEGDLKPQKNEVVLGYLKSYEHMGQARVNCHANCQCEESTFNGHFAEERASLTELHRFQATQHRECRLRVTVLDATSAPDGRRKVKLVGVMVVEGGFPVDAMGVQLDIFANRAHEEEHMHR